jgi:hypothetical protein
MKRSPYPITAEPSTALCSVGRPATGCAALSVLFGRCSRSDTTSAVSATAMATIPPASHCGGVTAARSTPSVTQLRADSTSAAPSPARPPRSIQARANSGSTSSAAAIGGPQPRAPD